MNEVNIHLVGFSPEPGPLPWLAREASSLTLTSLTIAPDIQNLSARVERFQRRCKV